MRGLAIAAVIAGLSILSTVAVGAQDSSNAPVSIDSSGSGAASTDPGSANVDNLFDNPTSDVQAKDSGTDYKAKFDASGTKVSGSISGTFGGGWGWTRWPDLSFPQRDYTSTIGFTGSTSATFDARPDPSFHATGTFTLNYNPIGSPNYLWQFSQISITQLYVDYNPSDAIFTRFGQFGMSWGQGRIFMPGNLVSDAANGLSVKITFPTVLSGISLVGLAQPAFFTTPKSPLWREITVGGTADAVIGGLHIGIGARYHQNSNPLGLLSLKTTILGADVFFDGVAEATILKGPIYQTMAGFYREWNDFKAYGEWYWNGTGANVPGWSNSTDAGTSAITAGGVSGHSIGIVLAYHHIFGSEVNTAAEWLHSFGDGSGSATLGVSVAPLSHLTIQMAMIPFSYGPSTGYYMTNSIDPAKRVTGLFALVTISSNF